MRALNAAERVRERLQEWAKTRGHGAGVELGKAMSGKCGADMSGQWASGIIKGKSDLRLKHLDAVAKLLGVPPGDLVRRDDDLYIEVIPTEFRFLKHLRALPDTVRHHWLAYLDYVFGFQDTVLSDQLKKVDGRTKAARLARDKQRKKGA